MNFKKWIFLLFSGAILLYVGLFITYILVDPDQIFNKSLTNYKFGYTKYFSKHQYEKLKKNEYILIFGTSRSQKLSSRTLNTNLLNFHNIYGEPGDILNFLQQLDEHQIKNVKHIYYLVSLDTMHTETSTINYKTYDFWDKLTEAFPLTNLSITNLMRDIIYNVKQTSIYYYIEEDGSQFVYDKNQTTVLNHSVKQQSNTNLKNMHSIRTLLQIDTFCKKHQIEITYYTPTYSNKYIVNLDEIEFLWKSLLEGGIDKFYGLYYIDQVSDDKVENRYMKFTDSSHLNYSYMNKVFETIVLNENKSYLIENERQLDKYVQQLRGKAYQD